MKRVHIFVSGKVHGVLYRASLAQKARALGVRGWVTNLEDGRVEVVLEGERELVDNLVQWCRTGTEWSKVSAVEVIEEELGSETNFEIR